MLHKHANARGCTGSGFRSHYARRSLSVARASTQQQTLSNPTAGDQQLSLLPRNVTEMVQQAVQAIKGCGSKRQTVQLLNPINEKATKFLSTEAMDYPCSNMKEFETLIGVARRVVAGVAGLSDEQEVKMQRIDEGGIDGDLCAVLRGGGLDQVVTAVVWPTAEKLKLIRKLAEETPSAGTVLLVNPQWKAEGNLVSEFGILPWDRKKNEDLVASFEQSYLLVEQRVGAPSSVADLATGARYASGAVVRVLRSWPGDWQVHVMAPDGASQVIGSFPPSHARPSYKELEAMIDSARAAKKEIFRVAAKASIEVDRPLASPSEREADEFYTRDQVLNMDAKQLRRVLMNLGLASSGAVPKLQARLLAVVDGISQGQNLEKAVEVAKKLR